MRFYPYKKGGGRKKFKPRLRGRGGGQQVLLGSFNTIARSFSHTEGDAKR